MNFHRQPQPHQPHSQSIINKSIVDPSMCPYKLGEHVDCLDTAKRWEDATIVCVITKL